MRVQGWEGTRAGGHEGGRVQGQEGTREQEQEGTRAGVHEGIGVQGYELKLVKTALMPSHPALVPSHPCTSHLCALPSSCSCGLVLPHLMPLCKGVRAQGWEGARAQGQEGARAVLTSILFPTASQCKKFEQVPL